MKSWSKVTITESCVLGGKFHSLCRDFQRAFIAAGAPEAMALYAQTYVLEDSRDIYFSPGSLPYVEELVRMHQGIPCTAPRPTDVTMVYGVPGADNTVFDGHSDKPVIRRAGMPRVAMAR